MEVIFDLNYLLQGDNDNQNKIDDNHKDGDNPYYYDKDNINIIIKLYEIIQIRREE